MLQSVGCDLVNCQTNETAEDFENISMGRIALTAIPLGAILLVFSLIYSGIKLMKRDRRAWFFAVAIMIMAVISPILTGEFNVASFSDITLIGEMGLIDLWAPILFDLIIPLAIIILLLLDRKDFFGKKEDA